jgi:hypothetical protein
MMLPCAVRASPALMVTAPPVEPISAPMFEIWVWP